MKSIKQILNVPILVLLLVAVFVGYKVSGTHYTTMQPTVVAVVRFDPLFKGLMQRADDKIQVEERVQENNDELRKRNDEISALEAELKDIVDRAMRREKSDSIGLKKLELSSWKASASAQAELEKVALLQELYKKICDAVNDIALANGYTLILLDDSNPYVGYKKESRVGPQLQVSQQITSQRILYVDPMIDITDQLTTRMNNDFIAANAN